MSRVLYSVCAFCFLLFFLCNFFLFIMPDTRGENNFPPDCSLFIMPDTRGENNVPSRMEAIGMRESEE